MKYMARLAGVSPHLMTLTGFFHGVLRVKSRLPGTYVVRYHILKSLEPPRAHHLTEVAGVLNIKKNTLSELIDRMVRDGLVRRAVSPRDRRVTVLRLTPGGRAAIREFEKGLMERMERFLDDLGEEDRRDLVRAIESLARILDRHDRRSGTYFPF
jgi:DNA-binding MarR family transcriptional regulator